MAHHEQQTDPDHTPAARVSRLLTGPVKGLRLHHPPSVEVSETGVVGDRRFFLADDDDTMMSVTRAGALSLLTAEYAPDTATLTVTDDDRELVSAAVELSSPVSVGFFGHHRVDGHVVTGPWEEFFSERVGQHVRLVQADVPNAACDLHSLTVLGDESISALSADAGGDVDPLRFRMNVGISGAAAFAEDEWNGSSIRVGDALIRIGGPVKRCAATTRDPMTGVRDLQTQRILKTIRGLQESELGRGVNLGVYATVLEPGTLHVGDELRIEDDRRQAGAPGRALTGEAGGVTPSH